MRIRSVDGRTVSLELERIEARLICGFDNSKASVYAIHS